MNIWAKTFSTQNNLLNIWRIGFEILQSLRCWTNLNGFGKQNNYELPKLFTIFVFLNLEKDDSKISNTTVPEKMTFSVENQVIINWKNKFVKWRMIYEKIKMFP
jgi:hypothetical protein